MNLPNALIPVLLLSLPTSSAGDSDRVLAQNFVRDFYSWYVPIANGHQKGISSDVVLEKKPNLFYKPLLKALKFDAMRRMAVSGEINGLDFDPFLNSQDPAPRYTPKGVQKWQGLYQVQIFESDSDGSNPRLAVTAEVRVNEGKCEFTNFYYPKGHSLMALLRRLHPGANFYE